MKKPNLPILLLVSTVVFVCSCSNKNATKSLSANRETSANWTVGVALYSFNLSSFPVSLAKADSAGVKFVEGFSFHTLRDEFKDSTMENISSHGILRLKQILDQKGMRMRSMYIAGAKDVQGWKRYFEIARTLDMQFLVGEPDPVHWSVLDSLGQIYSIKTAIHEHAKGSSRYWHPDSVLAAIKGHKNIGACADLGHWVRSGLDPVKCLNILRGHIIGIHLKDIAKPNDLTGEDVMVGKGVIDFPAVVRELKDQHFNGTIYIECEHNMNDNVGEIIASIDYFNQFSTQDK